MGAASSRHVTKLGASLIMKNTAEHGRYSRFTKNVEPLDNDQQADPTVMVRKKNFDVIIVTVCIILENSGSRHLHASGAGRTLPQNSDGK